MKMDIHQSQSVIMCNKSSSTSSTCSNKVRTTTHSSSNSLLLVVSDNNNSNNNKHGRSKAQMSLKRIIDIIVTGSSEKEKKVDDKGKKKGLGIDLNLRLGCSGTHDDANGFSSGCSAVIGGGGGGDCVNQCDNNVEFTSVSIMVKSCEGECDLKGVDVIEVKEEEERRELSEVTDIETPEIEGDVEMEKVVAEKREMGKNVEKGYMDLLVEAARLISGDFNDDETDKEEEEEEKTGTKRRRSKRNHECVKFDDFEDISPVVKSKRGRTQVLPLRYRDSVLDPWKSNRRPRSRVSNRNNRI